MSNPNTIAADGVIELPPLTVSYPRLRGRLHQVAAAVSVFGLIALLDAAQTPRARAAAWIYGIASILLYLTSSSYHVFARSPKARRIMQRADHSMIFVLIAGSFTPAALIALDDPWRWWSLGVMWGGAAIGITVKIVALERLSKLGGALYVVLGWAGLMAFPALSQRPDTLYLFAAGGVLYTVGAVFFALNRPVLRPEWFGYHEVWHSFTAAAGTCMYIANLGLVRAG